MNQNNAPLPLTDDQIREIMQAEIAKQDVEYVSAVIAGVRSCFATARQAPVEQDSGEPYMFKLPGDHDWQLGFAPLPEGAFRLKLLVGASTETPKLDQQQLETITALRMWGESGHRDIRLSSMQDRQGVKLLLDAFDRQAPDSQDAARYRFLRNEASGRHLQFMPYGEPEKIDAVIDAAIIRALKLSVQ